MYTPAPPVEKLMFFTVMRDQYTLDESETSIRLRDAWQGVLKRMQTEVQPQVLARFIKPLEPRELDGTTVKIASPGKFILDWVRERYLGTIQQFLSDELGMSVQVQLYAVANQRSLEPTEPGVIVSQPIVEAPPKFQPSDKYKFESYVVGQSNRLAVAGARAVAEQPGAKFNPLFIYGASGLGKTHILHAIAREIYNRDPKYPLVFVSAQQFAEDFINALQVNRVEQFRRHNRQVGIWLVDDIQFIAGKDKTQEEIFHTFNYLYSIGKQIVLTSDRSPRDLFMMDERLRTRFEAGLVVDVQMPDTETRCAIILSKAKEDGLVLNHDVAMHLAEHVPGNIRVLEGALTRLTVLASVNNVPLDFDLCSQMVEQYYGAGTLSKPSVNQIIDLVSKHFKVPTDEIKGPSRKAPIVHARHIAVFLSREITGDSWKHLASMFGDRDHTSMMHGYQKINEMMHYDKDLKSIVKMLLRNLDTRA